LRKSKFQLSLQMSKQYTPAPTGGTMAPSWEAMIVGQGHKAKVLAIVNNSVGLAITLIFFLMSVGGVFQCLAGCTKSFTYPSAYTYIDLIWLPPIFASVELLVFIVTYSLIFKSGLAEKAKCLSVGFLGTIQTVHFIIVPAGVVACLFFDAIVISERSISLGIQHTLFCNLDACSITCSFACDCTTDVGQCTFIGMRVLVCFWIFLRLLVLLLNIALLFDKKNGMITNKIGK